MGISAWTLARYFLALSFVAACTTTPAKAPAPECSALLQTATASLNRDGFAMAQTQQGPAGAMAVFVHNATARLLYLAPASAIADYLVTNGWVVIGSCTGPKAATFYLLQRDVEIPVGAPT